VGDKVLKYVELLVQKYVSVYGERAVLVPKVFLRGH